MNKTLIIYIHVILIISIICQANNSNNDSDLAFLQEPLTSYQIKCNDHLKRNLEKTIASFETDNINNNLPDLVKNAVHHKYEIPQSVLNSNNPEDAIKIEYIIIANYGLTQSIVQKIQSRSETDLNKNIKDWQKDIYHTS